ncbi:unnamed protein product, partial [Brassica rapa subsp. trilocularis]
LSGIPAVSGLPNVAVNSHVQDLQRPLRPPTHRGLALALTVGYRSRASAPSILGVRAVGHRNPASGSSRIASSAYQKWPTWSSLFRGMAQQSSHPVLPI